MRAFVFRGRRRSAVLCLALATVALVGLGCYRVNQQTQIVRVGYELREARTALRGLEEEARRLQLEYSVLTNPARIEELALSLGMVRPSPSQMRVIARPSKTRVSADTLQQSSRLGVVYWAYVGEDQEEPQAQP